MNVVQIIKDITVTLTSFSKMTNGIFLLALNTDMSCMSI